MHATYELGWANARRNGTYLDLQKVLGRAVQLLERLRARIRKRLHRDAGFGGDLVEEMAQEGSDEAGLSLRAANHGPDGLARTCRPLRQPSWFDRDAHTLLAETAHTQRVI
jgi:hypothetical protein